MMHKKDMPAAERRKYVRLDSVFPVQFKLMAADNKCSVSEWIQGFTCNVAKGGICLEVNNLKPELAEAIKTKIVKLSLRIDLPLRNCPVEAAAMPVWVNQVTAEPGKYCIGAVYENIDPLIGKRILRFAIGKKIFPPLALCLIGILGAGFLAGSYLNMKLVSGNKALVNQLVASIRESDNAKRQITLINEEKDDLNARLSSLSAQLNSIAHEKRELELAANSEKQNNINRINELSGLIDSLTKDRNSAQERLASLNTEETNVLSEILRINKKKATLEKANIEKMYEWLKVHQNPRIGLVMSFEGDKDIANWAFTYDQALAAVAYANNSDFNRSRKILDFFQDSAERFNGGFLNAYYAIDGKPAEYVVHSGPNIWLGIAILHFTEQSGESKYLKTAEEIAHVIIGLQSEDNDGGIRGGPEVSWYATEHNLDAYSFFNMLYKLTKNEKYLKARDRVLNWLVEHTYDKYEIPIKRGKGDSTIATDTYAWSIAAIGPKKLEELGMNPERIMEFAEKNCSVEVDFFRPEGSVVKVKGFDFAPERHVGRGGIVSSEWTAQMVLSFKIMADYFREKGLIEKTVVYETKADEYLASLGNMVISSPSASGQGESCLPYATQDFVDTGHGWLTPKGKSTGSVSGTAYTLFAYYKFNPLELKNR